MAGSAQVTDLETAQTLAAVSVEYRGHYAGVLSWGIVLLVSRLNDAIPPAAPPKPSRKALDDAAWAWTKNSIHRSDFQTDLRRFPNGRHSQAARARLIALRPAANAGEQFARLVKANFDGGTGFIVGHHAYWSLEDCRRTGTLQAVCSGNDSAKIHLKLDFRDFGAVSYKFITNAVSHYYFQDYSEVGIYVRLRNGLFSDDYLVRCAGGAYPDYPHDNPICRQVRNDFQALRRLRDAARKLK